MLRKEYQKTLLIKAMLNKKVENQQLEQINPQLKKKEKENRCSNQIRQDPSLAGDE